MATLTTSYQKIAEKYIGTSGGSLYVRVYAKYSQQDIANNKTKVQYQARTYYVNSTYIQDLQGSISVSGTSAATQSAACTKATTGEITWVTTEAWVSHNNDGSKTVTANASLTFPNWGWSGTASGTAALPTIPRQATLTSAPNFTDEENPTITYSNPAGNAVSALRVCISLTGSKDDVVYRDVSKTGTSYTFYLTEEERNTLRNGCTTANSRTVMFFLTTTIGGNTYYSTLYKTLSIVNAKPTISASAKDTNSTAIALTGDTSKIIKGYNAVHATMTAAAYKGATITNSYIKNNGKIYDFASGTITNAESGNFVFYAQDSRGNTIEKTINLTVVNYIPLTATIDGDMTVDGAITVTAKGNYFNGSFGNAANTLTAQYRYKTQGGSYSAWTAASATKSGNTYTAKIIITGLSYRNKYVVQTRVIDKLSTKDSNEITLACLPVFDWGENDFNFNVPVEMNGKATLNNSLELNSNFNMKGNYTEGCIYGLGGLPSIPSNSDLNDYKTPGAYAITSYAHAETISNLPSGITEAGKLIVYQALGQTSTSGAWVYLAQEFIPLNTRYPSFKRSMTTGANSTWSYGDWCPIGGDFIMEEGKSGIWTYRKWYSGKAECWGMTQQYNVDVTATWGNIYIRDLAIPAQTYPFTFVEAPVLQVSPRVINGNFWIYTNELTTTTTTGAFGVARGTSRAALPISASFYAIGRWK